MQVRLPTRRGAATFALSPRARGLFRALPISGSGDMVLQEMVKDDLP